MPEEPSVSRASNADVLNAVLRIERESIAGRARTEALLESLTSNVNKLETKVDALTEAQAQNRAYTTVTREMVDTQRRELEELKVANKADTSQTERNAAAITELRSDIGELKSTIQSINSDIEAVRGNIWKIIIGMVGGAGLTGGGGAYLAQLFFGG